MSAQPPPPPPRAGLSLYANLLDPPREGSSSSAASISRAPVVSQEALDAVKDTEAAKKSLSSSLSSSSDPALRFQPHPQIRRPQQKIQKPKVGFPKAVVPPLPPPPPPPPGPPASDAGTGNGNDSSSNNNGNNNAPPNLGVPVPVPAAAKSALADWAPTEEDEYMYGTGEKRARGGRRKKKKKAAGQGMMPAETDWDEIYDPARPTNVEEYLRSDEKIREVREWKALLYQHRKRRRSPERSRDSWDSDEEEEDERPAMGNQFAPPGSYSFAPPPMSPPRAPVPDDKTGDDAYARRLALSQGGQPPPPAQSPNPASPLPPPPPPPPAAQSDTSSFIPPPPPPPPSSEPDTATISRAPVRYAPPEPPKTNATDPDAMDEDPYEPSDAAPPLPPTVAVRGEQEQGQEEEGEGGEQPRSSRPGQKGFAARLMSKYGWSKGQGLGAESSGILQPLRVQVEKRKKRPDAEGGGWAEPGGRARIIAPKTGSAAQSQQGGGEDAGRFGPMSNVIVLRDMLEGMPDLQAEMEAGLAQEIGEECGDKYGRVERLKIDAEGRRVYIKFTDQVSALRAVNALDGRVFAGNTIVPQFYDADKFERMIYE